MNKLCNLIVTGKNNTIMTDILGLTPEEISIRVTALGLKHDQIQRVVFTSMDNRMVDWLLITTDSTSRVMDQKGCFSVVLTENDGKKISQCFDNFKDAFRFVTDVDPDTPTLRLYQVTEDTDGCRKYREIYSRTVFIHS